MIGTNNYTTWVKWLEKHPKAETKIVVSPIQTLYCIDIERKPVEQNQKKDLSYWCDLLDTFLCVSAKEKLDDYGARTHDGKTYYYMVYKDNIASVPCTDNRIVDVLEVTNALLRLVNDVDKKRI